MKKKFFITLFLCMVSVFFALEGCKGPGEKFDKKEALNVIEKINAAPTGFQIKAETSAIQVKQDPKSSKEAPRYFIIITDPEMTFNTSMLSEIYFPLPEYTFTFNCKKMVLCHGPDDNYLGLASFSGFQFEFDLLEPFGKTKEKKEKPGRPFSEVIIDYNIGEVTLDELNISPALDDEITFYDLITKVASLNQSLKSTVQELNVDMIVKGEKRDTSQIKFSADEILSNQEMNPDLIKFWFTKSEDNIIDLLREPQTLFRVSVDTKGISFSIEEKGKEKIKGILEQVVLSEYLIPSSEKEFYKFGITADMQNFELILPENKSLEPLGRIKKAKKEFNMDHLSISFLQTYFELAKKAQPFKDSESKATTEEMAAYGFGIMSEFFQSKPIISFSLPQLEHYFGKLEANAQFQFQQPGMPPTGKATATLYDLAGFEERIKKEEILPAEIINKIMDFIEKYFVQDNEGNGKLTFEVRKDEPNLFLNNEPLNLLKKAPKSIN